MICSFFVDVYLPKLMLCCPGLHRHREKFLQEKLKEHRGASGVSEEEPNAAPVDVEADLYKTPDFLKVG